MKNLDKNVKSLVNKALSETLEERTNHILNKLVQNPDEFIEIDNDDYDEGDELENDIEEVNETGEECNECGDKMMYEIEEEDTFDYTMEGDIKESNVEGCKNVEEVIQSKGGEPDELDLELLKRYNCKGINESLVGGQKKLDKNKDGKISGVDFKMMRKEKESCPKCGMKNCKCDHSKTETKESDKKFIQKATKEIEKKGTEGKFGKWCKSQGLDKEGEVTKKCIDKALKSKDTSVVKMANFAKNIKGYKGAEHKESVRLSESELIDLIELIIKEEKLQNIGGKPKGLAAYEKAHKGSGEENQENIKAVTKKMKDYLKDGSKGEYSMEPKKFPKGNGELEKMSTKKYTMSNDGKEFIDDFMRPGMENLDYDEIHPNEEWVSDNIEGSSKTGNNPKWANAEETELGGKINKKRKENKLAKAKRQAYNKSAQPVVKDTTGEDSGKGVNIKLESTDKQTKILNEEFDKIQRLMGYNRKTQ